MIFYTFPLFVEDTYLISLEIILKSIPDNNFMWNLLYFNGTGEVRNFSSILEFEEKVNSSLTGYIIKWNELKNISESVSQVYDCLIVAGNGIENIIGNKDSIDNFPSSSIIVDIFDSTNVLIGFHDEHQLTHFKKKLFVNLKEKSLVR